MIIDFNKDVIEESNDKIVIVDFYAQRCAPCRFLAPILEEIVKTYPRPIKLVKIDCDVEENHIIASKLSVLNIPDIRIYLIGVEVARFVGFKNKAAIEQILNMI